VAFNNLFVPKYEMFHHSRENRRGVGILISRSLQYTVIREYRDQENNMLALKIDICGSIILLVSIYGPNKNNEIFLKDF
jgi:exonuclease III